MIGRLTAVVALLLSSAVSFGQALADHVPGDAIVYVGWRGVADLGPGYSQSNLKAVLNECDVRQFVDEFLPAVMERVGREDPQAAEVTKILATIAKPSWQRPTAFFFAGIDLPQGGPPVPHLGVIWQPGADADALMQQLKQLTEKAQPPFPVKVVHAGDLVALMVGYDNAEAVLAGGEKSLAQDSTFKSSLAEVMKDPVAAIYIDYQKLLDMVGSAAKMGDPNAAEVLAKVRDKLGLNGLKRIIATSGFDGKDWGTMLFVDAPEPRTGLLKMANGKPIGEQVLSLVPKGATMAGVGQADFSTLLPTIRETLRDVQPQAADQVDEMLKALADQSGVDIEKDLIGSLGPDWAYFVDPMAGGQGLAGLTIVNRLKDPERFEKSLSKIEDFALKQIEQQMGPADKLHLRFDTVQLDGMTVHYLAVPLVSPSWVVHDGNLYAAAFPQVAAAAAKRGTDAGSSILHNPGFTALRERLGHSSDATGMTFDDLPQTAPQAYGAWLMISRVAGFADLFGIKSPPILLPPLQKLVGHLSPAGSVKWVDNKGIHMRGVEPFPGSTMVASDPAISAIYAEPLLVSIMLPAINKAREQANQVKSINNLRQIGLGAIMYANANNQQFPPDLATMVQDQDMAAAVFVNPRTDHPMPPPGVQSGKNAAQWVKENSDYVYVGAGKKASAPAMAETIIAYEKPENVTDAVNIAFADGHCELVERGRALDMIQKAKQ